MPTEIKVFSFSHLDAPNTAQWLEKEGSPGLLHRQWHYLCVCTKCQSHKI